MHSSLRCVGFILSLKDAGLTDSQEASGPLFIHGDVSALWVLRKHYLHIFNLNETSIRARQLVVGRNNELDSVVFACVCVHIEDEESATSLN